METRNCSRIGIDINGQPVVNCFLGTEQVWVLPTIKKAFKGKFVGIRERIVDEAERMNRRLVIRVQEPELECVVSPSEVKSSLKIKQKSKYSGFYTIYMYNIIQELRKSKQAVLI